MFRGLLKLLGHIKRGKIFLMAMLLISIAVICLFIIQKGSKISEFLYSSNQSDLLIQSIERKRYTEPDYAKILTDTLIELTINKANQQLYYAKGIYWRVWLESRKYPFFSSFLFFRDELQLAGTIFEKNKQWDWLALCFNLAATIHAGQFSNEPDNQDLQDSVLLYLQKGQLALDQSDLPENDRRSIQADLFHTEATLKLLSGASDHDAVEAFNKSLVLYEEAKDLEGQAKVYLNLMWVVNPDTSIILQKKAVTIYQNLQYPLDEAKAYQKLNDFCLVQYRNDSDTIWLQYSQEAIENYMMTPDAPYEDCRVFIRLGELLKLNGDRGVPEAKNAQYKKAFYNYLVAYKKGLISRDIPCAKMSANKMATLCDQIGTCHIAIQEIADSLFVNFTALMNTAKLDESEKRRFERTQEKLKVQQRSTLWGLAGAVILLGLGGAFFINRLRTKHKQIQLEQSHQLALAEERNHRLVMQDIVRKFRLDKHFISNALNNMQGLIHVNKVEVADQYIVKLGNYISEVLSISDGQLISLQKDIELNELFMGLNQSAFPNKISFSPIEVDPSLDINNIEITPLIAQPDIENAIKHGLRNRDSLGKLSVAIKKTQKQQLTYVIEDNGVGRKISQEINRQKGIRTRPSMGGRIVENAIETLNQQHSVPPGEAETHPLGAYRKVEDIVDEADNCLGTRVCITIPYTLKEI